VSTPTPISSVVLLPEYLRDLKVLSRRFRGLDEDVRLFVEKPLTHFLRGEPVAGRNERAAGLGFEYPVIYIAKRLACRALRGRGSDSGLRVVCAWFPREDRLELVELYYKGDKQVEDKARIKRIYGR
jgi:hypothetical protein